MVDSKFTEILFPGMAGILVDEVTDEGRLICIRARVESATANCPSCGNPADRVHDRYERRVADAPVGGRQVVIRLLVRRFICATSGCTRRTFVEQVAKLTVRYGRRTVLLHQQLQSIAAALAGRPGQRLAARMAIATSRSTLLRLLRAIPAPAVNAGPRVLGIDDFAIKRGQVYASILLDMDTHRPIDVLGDRTAETFATWLRAHPGVEIICRDRASAYANGARTGAPTAIQVADRFHLWANLGEAVEKTVIAHRACLPEPAPVSDPASTTPPAAAPDPTLDVNGQQRRLVVRKRERYAAIQDLRAQGHSLNAISRQLGVCFRTVQRYANATSLDDLLATAVNRPSTLDSFTEYLHQRWNEGLTDAVGLQAELRTRGWRGSLRTVERYVRPLRALARAPEATPAPKPRRVTGWIMTDPPHLSEEHTAELQRILARCPELQALRRHVASFAVMMRDLRGDQLDEWMRTVLADDLPALHSFAAGLQRDHAAVTNGLTLPYSSGAVEGAVNRVKALKRAMFGRANLDLLRLRILLPR